MSPKDQNEIYFWVRQQVIDDIMIERMQQIDIHGFDEDHDDRHGSGQIAKAAACYAHAGGDYNYPDTHSQRKRFRLGWPWSPGSYKPTTRRRDLIKAAALLMAEIERIDRSELRIKDET